MVHYKINNMISPSSQTYTPPQCQCPYIQPQGPHTVKPDWGIFADFEIRSHTKPKWIYSCDILKMRKNFLLYLQLAFRVSPLSLKVPSWTCGLLIPFASVTSIVSPWQQACNLLLQYSVSYYFKDITSLVHNINPTLVPFQNILLKVGDWHLNSTSLTCLPAQLIGAESTKAKVVLYFQHKKAK